MVDTIILIICELFPLTNFLRNWSLRAMTHLWCLKFKLELYYYFFFADKKLFTPGPLTCSASVKSAMLRDLGSRDTEFKGATKYVRDELLKVAQVDNENWTCVPMQGSGSFAVEAVLQTAIPRQNGKVISWNFAPKISKIPNEVTFVNKQLT